MNYPVILLSLKISQQLKNFTIKTVKAISGKALLFCYFILFLNIQLGISQISHTQNIRLRSQLKVDNQSGANICGYAQKGREYALVGTNQGTVIVDVTNPDLPKNLKLIPAVKSLWREIKVYKNYAYITTEGSGQGLQIVDLSALPDTTIAFKDYKGGDSILTNIAKIHSLHVDTTKGYVYLFGGSSQLSTGVSVQGATVLDLKDPWNPKFIGYYNGTYIHDGYVNNDTLYGGHIYGGYFSIINFKDKKNPVVINTQKTPTAFTHNTWPSVDGKTIFTTDENAGSYLAAYNVSDVANIKSLDKIRTVSGDAAIIHNTHIINDFAVTSWYTEGVTIVDAHRPQNLVQVGQYDTYDGSGAKFNGCWGVYPFLPSGNLVTSSLEGDLHVLTPQYIRASYLEGNVIDSITRKALSGVRVKINSNDPDKAAESNPLGNYYTGQVSKGSFSVTYSKVGYYSKTVTVSLNTGQVTTQNIELLPRPRYVLNGNVVSDVDGKRLSNGYINLKSGDAAYNIKTDSAGNFMLNDIMEDTYEILAGAWGYRHKSIPNLAINQNLPSLTIRLSKGYQDDFWGDFGWEVSGSIAAGANQGRWERAAPILSVFNNEITSPAADVPNDFNGHAYITGNGGGDGGANDVDGGPTILTSPVMNLKNSVNPTMTFSYWFVNTGGDNMPNDRMNIYLSNGIKDTLIFSVTTSSSVWRGASFPLKGYLALTDSMRVRFSVADDNPGHIVEAGLDAFKINEMTSTVEIANNWTLEAFPNPFSSTVSLNYKMDEANKNAKIKVTNLLGQTLESHNLPYTEGGLSIGENLPEGVYILRIETESKVSKAYKIIKK